MNAANALGPSSAALASWESQSTDWFRKLEGASVPSMIERDGAFIILYSQINLSLATRGPFVMSPFLLCRLVMSRLKGRGVTSVTFLI